MTPAALDFIAQLESRRDLFAAKEKVEVDTYARGLYAGWKAATIEALRQARSVLEDVEREARMVPETEEPYDSLRERLMDGEWA